MYAGTRAGPLLAHPVELAPNLTGKDASHYSRSSPEYLGALGATVGHLRALAAAEAAGVDAALILEDDVVTDLLPFWQFGSLWDFVDRLPAGWSAVQLAMIASEDTWDSAFSAWSAAAWPPTLEADPFWSNAAYLVSRRALREFLAPPLRPEGQPGTFDLTVFHVLNWCGQGGGGWRDGPTLLHRPDTTPVAHAQRHQF